MDSVIISRSPPKLRDPFEIPEVSSRFESSNIEKSKILSGTGNQANDLP